MQLMWAKTNSPGVESISVSFPSVVLGVPNIMQALHSALTRTRQTNLVKLFQLHKTSRAVRVQPYHRSLHHGCFEATTTLHFVTLTAA